MTALEAYDLVTSGGGSDFAKVIALCEAIGSYCLIGGLAVNCYVEPVYTMDADLVVVSSEIGRLSEPLRDAGFKTSEQEHSMNAQAAGSELRIQFTTDSRYQDFLSRASVQTVLGVPVRVASLEDVTRGKLWAYSDPSRRLSKRKKDELDLIRLAEAWPHLKATYPPELAAILDSQAP
ncbi:MAG TPA: hypothetical protein VHB50_10465 [Bryobacteraceae bacterium]|nr:hypothetical protein [Bryobacteraceae bacterium]